MAGGPLSCGQGAPQAVSGDCCGAETCAVRCCDMRCHVRRCQWHATAGRRAVSVLILAYRSRAGRMLFWQGSLLWSVLVS